MKKLQYESEQKRVLVVDDHPIICQGIATLMKQEPDLTVCGDAANVPAALEAIDKLKPHVVIVDIALGERSGIELIKDIKVRWPRLPVLVLSMHKEAFYAERVLRAGARGYLTKAEASAKVVEGVRQVLGGGVYVSEEFASKMLCKLVPGTQDSEGFLLDKLSDREFEVFEWIALGLQMREIAQRLHLSVKTIEAHREHIKAKLQLDSAAELLKYAIQWSQFERTT